jgi:membrane-associated phospholipid phosphatase
LLKQKLRGLYESDWTMLGIVISIYLIWRIGIVGGWSQGCWVLLLVCLIGIKRDQIEMEWKKFFVIAIPLLGLFYYFYNSGSSMWWHIAHMMFQNNNPWNWDNYMKSIPYNSGMFVRRIFHSHRLDNLMIWVYNYGFVLSLWVCIVRSFWTRNIKKMLSYALSGHLLQFPLILPFYNLFLLHEVWWVNQQPDLLNRTFANHNEMMVTIMNCFPSMHTSISFAMLLLALRERDRIFKCVMVLYCTAIIYSTMYLQIHWILDVFAGMAFAFGTVKLSDGILQLASKVIPTKFTVYMKNETHLKAS